MDPIGCVLAVAGAFALSAAIFDWDWFMNARKAQFFVGLFGRGGTRILYGLLGMAFLVYGMLVLASVVPPPSR